MFIPGLLVLFFFTLPLQVENSSRRGRRGRGGESSEESPPQDGAVFDQWEAANTGGLGGAGSVTRQKVGQYGMWWDISLTSAEFGCCGVGMYRRRGPAPPLLCDPRVGRLAT